MVFFFTSREGYIIYMGKDKFENEDLIKYGLPEDIWFHVDDLSSAHVYLRLNPGQTMDGIPESVLEECAQLVKANSIQGSKQNDIKVVYTPWSNLKKTNDMDVGAIGFHNQKLRRYCKVYKKDNMIVNRLNKTKREEHPNLAELQRKRQKEMNQHERDAKRKAEQEAKLKQDEKRKMELQRTYQDGFFDEDKAVSNKDMDANYEDDFM